MHASIFGPFSHAEQQYLMYLHYCKGRFRVGVGVTLIKHNLIGRKKNILLVSGSLLAISLLYTTTNITRNYCMCITVRVSLGLW